VDRCRTLLWEEKAILLSLKKSLETGRIVINFMKTKEEFLGHLRALFIFTKKQTGYSIQVLTTDNGTELKNANTIQ
jgi:hypothetical protein